jgi:hypothetical protein
LAGPKNCGKGTMNPDVSSASASMPGRRGHNREKAEGGIREEWGRLGEVPYKLGLMIRL